MLSQFTISQLEKNLIYKTSNRIKFIVFDQLNEFESYQKEQGLSDFQMVNFKPIQVYYPIFIGVSRQKIEYQLRKGAASQFIGEYLFGLSYREQSEGITHSPIPPWIIKGFVSYFAGGIEVFDFQQFVLNNRKGYFKNINFIPEHAQANFGCIIWYLFEKEKGRGFNSAFWYLIKYVNSFQESFEYQFGLTFKKWLKSKISEIEKRNRLEILKSDYQKNIPQYDNFRLIQSLSFGENQSSDVFINLATPHKQILLLDNRKSLLKLHETQCLSQDFKTNFNQFEIVGYSIENSTNPTVVLLHFFEGHWLLTQIQSNGIPIKSIDLGEIGGFRNLKSVGNSFMLLHDINGVTQIVSVDFQKNFKTVYESKNYHLFDFQKDNQSIYTLFSEVSLNHVKYSFVVRNWENGKKDTVYRDSHSLAEVRFDNFIIENQNHFSFIKSGEHQQQIVHLFQKNGMWNVQKLETKGYFFQQKETMKENGIFTAFQSTTGVQITQFAKDEMIFAQDTFIKQLFSFDTIRLTNNILKPDSIINISNGIFLSHLKFIPSRDKSKRIRNHLFFQTPIKSTFSQAFYTTLSKLYIGNDDLDIPYRSNMPLNSTFNSLATIFFKQTIESNDKKHRFYSNAFSSIDRNRYGIQFRYTYFKLGKMIAWEIGHRSRQYKLEFGDLFDNKVTKFATSLSTNYHLIGTSVKVSYQIQTDITLNTNEVATTRENRHLQIGEMSFSLFPKKSIEMGNLSAYGTCGIHLASGYKTDTFVNFSRLSANANLKYTGRFFEIKSKFNAVYSLFNANIIQYIGGSKGSLLSNQFDLNPMNQVLSRPRFLIENGGNIRGFPVGSRIGSNSLVIQSELLISPLNLFPSRVIESTFWKKLFLVGFLDFGTAFLGSLPSDKENPYNTKMYQNNSYTISVNAERDAYLLGIGYGVNLSIWGYEIRIERAFGFNENELQNRMIHVSLGKNF